MQCEYKTIGECCNLERNHILPKPGTKYELYSLPAFDNSHTPESVDGDSIKSGKLQLSSNTILFNKLNVKFRRVWNIKDVGSNAICSTEFLPLKVNDGVDQDFLYYILTSNEITTVMHNARRGTSCSQQRIDADTLFAYKIYLPKLSIQKRISKILYVLDEKIANNNAINNNLQQQAQALFNEWFTDKTDGFEDISLAALMNYAGGSQPPASEFISEPKEGYIRFVQIRDYETDGYITYIPISGKNKLCDEHDIMIARYGASLGRICFGLSGAYNVALAKVFPTKAYYREFLRCYLSSREFYEGINNRGGRSAQAGFNESDIRSFILPFPCDDRIVCEFESITAPMFAQRLALIKENRKLSILRDTLLPKLISGEIDVSNVEL